MSYVLWSFSKFSSLVGNFRVGIQSQQQIASGDFVPGFLIGIFIQRLTPSKATLSGTLIRAEDFPGKTHTVDMEIKRYSSIAKINLHQRNHNGERKGTSLAVT